MVDLDESRAEPRTPTEAAAATAQPPIRVDAANAGGRALLLRTAGMVGVIATVGSLLGLVRDILIARYFGANGQTDAFLVAWTIPETATPLLMEGAMSMLLVPLLSREIELRGTMQRAVDRTFLPVASLLGLLAAIVALAAPWLVDALAPGLVDPSLAVRCVRVASLCIFFLGVSGYLMATLRSTDNFTRPAWVYAAYNIGILAMIIPLHDHGVFVAAVGLAVGSGFMVLIQLPPFLKRVSVRSLQLKLDRRLLIAAYAFLPLATYSLGRQAQVYVERFLGSDLAAGAITHLNYAAKIAQIPMQLVTVIAAVSMPSLARHAAGKRHAELKVAVEHNIRLGSLLILPATAALVALSPYVVRVLFERGAFNAEDTAATAEIMRVYSFGLLGQVLVAVFTTSFFSVRRASWYPGMSVLVGLAVTVVVSAVGAHLYGAPGIAAGNAAGILTAAAILLAGIRRRVIDISVTGVLGQLLRCACAAVVAGFVGWTVAKALDVVLPTIAVVALAGLAVLAAYLVVALMLRVPEAQEVITAARGRLRRRSASAAATTEAKDPAATTSATTEANNTPARDTPPRRRATRRTTPGRLGVIAAMAMLGAVLGFLAAKIAPTTYTSTTTLLVVPASDAGSHADPIGFAQAGARIITKPSILAPELDPTAGVTYGDLQLAVRATATPSSPLIELSADARTPERAARIADAVARASATILNRDTGRSGFRVINETAPLVPDTPTSPNTAVDVLAGGVVGGLVGLGALIVAHGRRRR